ncbi:MAG: cell surface protein SprA [Bacteroidetes bacterium]|nr:MAG: cell surface protein SprA [Bacteroidota bacterium]
MNLAAYIFRLSATILFAFLLNTKAEARTRNYSGNYFFQDTTVRFPLNDRRSDAYSNPGRNTFDFRDTSYIKRNIEYDPKTKQYYIIEKIGSSYYRTPISFSMQEFLNMQGKKDEIDYFKKRSNMLANMNRKIDKPKFKVKPDWFNRIVGTGKVEIKPSGYVDLLAGYQGQKIANPTLPERARNNGGFDFNMSSQLQVDAKIGDKLKLPINYNTLANFDFENQLKLDYEGKSDDILKVFKAGNVEFNSKGTLIPGAQGLFGLKTQLQFGKFYVTGVMANMRSTRQTAGLSGGTATQNFSLRADDYEENRHFLLSQYFRANYNKAMKQLPIVNSPIQILRLEVWVTNRQGATTDTRDIVALMDLGEGKPFGPWGGSNNDNAFPGNNANSLYGLLTSNPAIRNSSTITNFLNTNGLTPVQDFEKTYARKLQPSDYIFNPQIGFVSLNQPLQPDEVLGIAFQYAYNGRYYQVGEFSTDVPPDTTGNTQNVLFLKLLKATSQRTYLPIWELMMKNVYSVGFGQLERQDFKLDINYEEPSLGEKRFLPAEDVTNPLYKGQPLIQQTNLDRLNNQNDPQVDGVFDFIEGFTVLSTQSRIIFPVLEPFGHDLDYVYDDVDSLAKRKKYLYYPLYDTIKAIAQTYANLNRFKLVGKSKSSVSSDYQLGFNIPRGSVTVSAGGQILQENIDYEINYDLGTLRVTNQAIINSGVQVNVQYENQGTFALQQKNYLAARFDYLASKKLSLGGTIVRLGERPFFVKQNYGEDPIRNTMYGLDADYRSDIPRLSKWLDKLPWYNTKEMSSITAYGEVALLDPGHAKQIGKGEDGVIYIDDFEGTRAPIDLRFPIIGWTLASTPQKSPNQFGTVMFPEAELSNNLNYNNNRAKFSWYNIESVLQEKGNPNNPLRNDLNEISKPETRQVYQNEIFPKKSTEYGQGLLTTFDLHYQPKEKGPYNYESRNTRINGNGTLLNPRNAWGGIMRNIDQIDFETGNVEFIEFWLQDPFISNPSSQGGDLYFNLGNISEDILRDGKRMYENGLPTTSTPNVPVDNNTVWGRAPSNPLQVTNAFTNNEDERVQQDVGLDGLNDDEENLKQAAYLNTLLTNFGAGSLIYQAALGDPSADNFVPYRSPTYDQINAGIIQRYKNINSPQGNSPTSQESEINNPEFVNAFTQYPDQEDLNRDNTMNEVEEYFQYRVKLSPNMIVGTNFITDKRTVQVTPPNGITRPETWYLFRIPVSQYHAKVGNIPDFKSIRFIRMFLTDFSDSVTLRFGKLELIRNQWRKFTYQIDTLANYVNLPANDPVVTNTLAVNIEENDQRQPIRYVIPPGIERQQQLGTTNTQIYLNEQSLSYKVCGLPKFDSRGIFKNMNLDMRQYGKLRMFVHAEKAPLTDLDDRDLNAIVRLGSDAVSNFYEIKVPLKLTDFGETDSTKIWPDVNNLDFDLEELTRLKTRRNKSGISNSQYYKETDANGKSYAIIGNPNLGEVRIMLMGVENVGKETACAEVWFNELRFSNLDEQGGWAGIGRLNIKGADLFDLSLSVAGKSTGFGTLEQRVNERSREDIYTIDLSANINAGLLFPKKFGLQIPVFAGVSKVVSSPEYDPYALDLKLKDVINEAPAGKQDSIKNDAQTITTIKTVNLTNVKKLKTDGKKPKPWSVTNLDFNYSYLATESHDPLIENDLVRRTRGAIAYNYSPQVRPVEPFKKMIKSNSKWLTVIKDINLTYAPTQISIRADVFRQYGSLRVRNVGGGPYKIPETYNKYFTFDRFFIIQWPLTKSINIDYNAINNSRIDEPYGRIDTKEKKDSVRKNFFKGGRNTNFQQNINFSYNVPTQKIPFLDWTTVRASYNVRYNWQAASLLARSLGNTLSNGNTKNLNGELNFEQLYDKSKFLRAVYKPKEQNINPNPAPADPNKGGGGKSGGGKSTGKNKNDKAAVPAAVPGVKPIPQSLISPSDTAGKNLSPKQLRKLIRQKKKEAKKQAREANKNNLPEVGGVTKAFFQVLTSVKHVGIQYTEELGTSLPGYLDSTRFMGHNFKSGEPGLDFILGYQPDTNWINRMGAKQLFSQDTLVSALLHQRYNQRLGITAQVSPFRDFNIDLNLDKTYDKNYSELYKDTSKVDNIGLTRLSPYSAGSFSISFIAFNTLFQKFNPNEVSETFKTFESYRQVLSNRLKETNPYASGNTVGADGYVEGYGRYAQDVVIPAFIAAYTKKDPYSVSLFKSANTSIRSNPFSGLIPRPNWALTYNGLSRLPGMDKVFTNFSVRHGYHSTFNMNSFNKALFFEDAFRIGFPSFQDTLTGNYVPYFLVPNITIQEAFDPMFELDMTFANQMSFRVEYRKSRTLSLSLIDYQLAENRSEEVTVGFNWRKRGVPFLKNTKIGAKLDNDVTFKFDFSVRDDATANTKLDQHTSFGTAGQKVIRIAPSIDYVLNKRINLKFYFEQNRNIPKISNSFPITNTRAGVQVRISLNQ